MLRGSVVNGRVGWLSDRENNLDLGHMSSSSLHNFGSRPASRCMLASKGSIFPRYVDLQLGSCASGDTRSSLRRMKHTTWKRQKNRDIHL